MISIHRDAETIRCCSIGKSSCCGSSEVVEEGGWREPGSNRGVKEL